ncbi:hypothetical protein KCU74_g30, partial [Aureobasidium melanogenum]
LTLAAWSCILPARVLSRGRRSSWLMRRRQVLRTSSFPMPSHAPRFHILLCTFHNLSTTFTVLHSPSRAHIIVSKHFLQYCTDCVPLADACSLLFLPFPLLTLPLLLRHNTAFIPLTADTLTLGRPLQLNPSTHAIASSMDSQCCENSGIRVLPR